MTRSLGKMVIPPWSAPPGSPDAGELYYDTDDGSFQWRDGVAATWRSALSHQLADAKGDLLAASAADVLVRLPVGSNDHVLTADSAQSLGVKWAAAPGAGGSSVPPGVILPFGASAAPAGYSVCDGAAKARTGTDGDGKSYVALFAVIGTTYGVGNGSTTFNLPNLKGRVPVGLDAGQAEFDALAETGGAKTHTLATTELPAHAHKVAMGSGEPIGAYRTNAVVNNGAGVDLATAYNSTSNQIGAQNTGGGLAHQNLSPYVVVQYIIKL
jgi:microcystin-dependent protein